MKILLVSSFLPYPLFSGGHVRLFNLLKELSSRHEITLVCEKRKHQTERDIDEVKKFCKEIFVVERKKQWSPEVVVKTAISSLPFLLTGHTLPHMQKILSKLISENRYDLIHVETFYVFQNLPQTTLPVVLAEHNIEYKVYQRFADSAPFLLRPLLQIDVEKIKYWEKFYWEKATKIIGVSEVEARQMRSDAEVIANGVDLDSFPFKKNNGKNPSTSSGPKAILFMGDFKWLQNTTTALWILKEIWPELGKRSKELKIKLWIVGKHVPENIKIFASENIIIDEHAPDKTSDIYKKADVLLAPIKVGGGTSYKILEAMASGVPVVTTHLGLEGLGAVDKRQALVGESSDLLAQQVEKFLTEKKLYNDIAKNARHFIEEKYSWKEIAKKLEKIYEDAVKK